jgi:hypothetical protein
LASAWDLDPGLLQGDIEIQNGQVIGKVYGIQFYAGSDYPAIEIAAWEEKSLQRNLCTYYPLQAASRVRLRERK